MQRIVFFDIDGTLLSTKGKVLDSTQQAILRLKQDGIMPVLATGRAPVLVAEIAESVGIDSYISMNGQYIVIEGREFYNNPIQPDTLKQFTQYAKSQNDGFILCGSEEIFSGTPMTSDSKTYKMMKFLSQVLPSRIQMSFLKRSMKKYPDPNSYESKPIYQAILQAPPENEIDYISEFPTLRFTRSNPIMYDVIKNGTSKATGIQRVIEHYNVSLDQTIAFGDHLNDLEMLQHVGVGVAMGNAEPETKEVSDFITRHVDEDGIYHELVDLGIIPDFLNKSF